MSFSEITAYGYYLPQKLLKNEDGVVDKAYIKEGSSKGTSFLFIDETPYYEEYKAWVAAGNTAEAAD